MDEPTDAPIQLDGKLLIADPSLRDSIFNKSVILMAEHENDEGAHGIILNTPTGQTVGDLLKDEMFAPLKNLPVHVGGPVGQEHLHFAAFWLGDNQELRYVTRISAKDAITYTQQSGTLVRAFAGYSGWDAGQLEDELRKNSWITAQPTSTLLSSTHEKSLWRKLLREISPFHKILAEAPDDIFLN